MTVFLKNVRAQWIMMNVSDLAPQQSPLLCSLTSVMTALIAGIVKLLVIFITIPFRGLTNLLHWNTFFNHLQDNTKKNKNQRTPRSESLIPRVWVLFGWLDEKAQSLASETVVPEENKSEKKNKIKVSLLDHVYCALLRRNSPADWVQDSLLLKTMCPTQPTGAYNGYRCI